MGLCLPWRASLWVYGRAGFKPTAHPHSAQTHWVPPSCRVSSRQGAFSGDQDGPGAWPHWAYELEGRDQVTKQENVGLKSDLTESNPCVLHGGLGQPLRSQKGEKDPVIQCEERQSPGPWGEKELGVCSGQRGGSTAFPGEGILNRKGGRGRLQKAWEGGRFLGQGVTQPDWC